MEAYELIIFGSVILILSFLYGEIAKRTNIPSVLMLIATGVIIGQIYNIDQEKLGQPLELLGVIGLIMIVLEGALDLSLKREKVGTIFKALGTSFFSLLFTNHLIAGLFYVIFNMDWLTALLYATPLSIISSAIVIPSIAKLKEGNREFLVYESCFSDIIGIMIFNFIVALFAESNFMGSLGDFTISLVLSIVLGVLVTFGLVILFKYVKSNVKLVLIIAILMVLYAVAKLLHFAPLILILFFGIALKNHELFFGGRLRKYFTRMEMKSMEKNFHIITRETAFVLRTYFFVIFGLSISLTALLDVKVLLISVAVIGLMYGARWVLLRLFTPKSVKPLLYVAPRGLITILLFFSIPAELKSEVFEEGTLLFVILLSSFIMTYGLIQNEKRGWELSPPLEGDLEPETESDIPSEEGEETGNLDTP
jgi:potassium/hydrogen antiporter